MKALWSVLAAALVALGSGCSEHGEVEFGAMELGLTTEAHGVAYRLAAARFALDGPAKREFTADGDDELTFDLPSGSYRLTLLEGYQLVRADRPEVAMSALLISQNPAPVLITAGQTARVTLRFELPDGSSVATGEGKLAIDIAVGAGDAGVRDTCTTGLRINEIDYEQASADDREFVEILNTASCSAQLAAVQLELTNGSDGRVYGRYSLADAGAELAPGERLVIADMGVLEQLPQGVKRLPLNASGLQNGPDGVRIVEGERALDGVSYAGPTPSYEGAPTVADEGPLALARCPDGFDTEDGALDFRLAPPTPGAPNDCAAPPPPPPTATDAPVIPAL